MKKTLLFALITITFNIHAQTWQVLPNAPLSESIEVGYQNFDDITFCDDNTGFICNISGKIYRTTDGGDSWTLVLDSPGSSFTSLAFINCTTGYVGNLGRGDWVGATVDNTLMYKTNDGGTTWSEVTSIPTTHNPKGINSLQAIDGQNIVGAGRYDDPAIFYKSTDGGVSWTTRDLDDYVNADGLLDIHFFNVNTGIITGKRNGQSRVWRTTDGGDSWSSVLTAYGDAAFRTYFLDDLNGYINIANYDNLERRYYYTTDGGITWTEGVYIADRGDGFWGVYEGIGIGFFDTTTGWCAGSATTYETTDGGATFTEINIDPTYDDNIHRFIKTSETTMYAVGSRVYKYVANNLGIIENNFSSELLLYPNPTDGNFSLDLGENYREVVITMTDLAGKVIRSKKYSDSKLLSLKIKEPTGIYLLVIESGNKKAVIRLVKE